MTNTQTGKEGAVAAAVENLRKAIIAADKAALDKIALPELTYGHSTGRLENKAEFIEALVSGKSGFSEIEVTGETISVVNNIALVRHIFHGTQRKESNKVKMGILTVWMQQQDQWKLVARQSVKV